MSKCGKCGLDSFAYITSIETKGRYCVDCYTVIKEDKYKLINSLPDASDVEPPLGYKFVGTSWFTIEFLGKAKADHLWRGYGTTA